jgi:hypothetical protein
MTTRTRTETLTFSNSFRLTGLDEQIPAGTYEVEIEEERLGDVSFPAYRRVLTLLHLGSTPLSPGTTRTVSTDQQALDTAIAHDRAPGQPGRAGLPVVESHGMDHPTATAETETGTADAAEMTADALARYGITRVPVDYFHLGGFRYTSLPEAIAQARRQQGAEGKR